MDSDSDIDHQEGVEVENPCDCECNGDPDVDVCLCNGRCPACEERAPLAPRPPPVSAHATVGSGSVVPAPPPFSAVAAAAPTATAVGGPAAFKVSKRLFPGRRDDDHDGDGDAEDNTGAGAGAARPRVVRRLDVSQTWAAGVALDSDFPAASYHTPEQSAALPLVLRRLQPPAADVGSPGFGGPGDDAESLPPIVRVEPVRMDLYRDRLWQGCAQCYRGQAYCHDAACEGGWLLCANQPPGLRPNTDSVCRADPHTFFAFGPTGHLYKWYPGCSCLSEESWACCFPGSASPRVHCKCRVASVGDGEAAVKVVLPPKSAGATQGCVCLCHSMHKGPLCRCDLRPRWMLLPAKVQPGNNRFLVKEAAAPPAELDFGSHVCPRH